MEVAMKYIVRTDHQPRPDGYDTFTKFLGTMTTEDLTTKNLAT